MRINGTFVQARSLFGGMKMETSEQNSSKKKLVVPLIALMLCAVAVLGIGYGLTSSSTNTSNVVSGDALVADLRGTDGTASLGEGKFASDVTLKYQTSQTNGVTKASIAGTTPVTVGSDPVNAVKIGGGKLSVTGTSAGDVTVKVDLSTTAGAIPSDMKFILAGSSNQYISVGSQLDAGKITLAGSDHTFTGDQVFTLYAVYNDVTVSGSIPDFSGFTYQIVFTVSK